MHFGRDNQAAIGAARHNVSLNSSLTRATFTGTLRYYKQQFQPTDGLMAKDRETGIKKSKKATGKKTGIAKTPIHSVPVRTRRR